MNRRDFLKAVGATGGGILVGGGAWWWNSGRQKPVSELRSLGLMEPWRNNGENAPFHVAIEAGYYRDEGLQVNLVEGGPGINGAINVLSGAQDIEIGCNASVGALVPQLSEGLPFVMTAAILQTHPLAYVILSDKLSAEQRARDLIPADLKGRKVGVQAEYEVYALLKRNGMQSDDVEIVRIAGENPADLLTNTVDFASYWIVNQPWGLVKEGLEWKALMFAEWGIPLYADVIYTTRERLKKDPELMRAFLRATKRGMQRMIDDPQFAVEASLKHGGGYDDAEKLAWRIGLQNNMMQSADTKEHGLGWMDENKVKESIDFFAETNEIRTVPDTKDIMTVEFLT